MNGIGKARAFLTEFIIVILFFSLSAVITLQLFLAADQKSELSTEKTNAYIKLQTIGESVKTNREYLDSFFSKANGWDSYVRYYDEDFNLCEKEASAYLLKAEVTQTEKEAGDISAVQLEFVKNTEQAEVLGELLVTTYLPDWGVSQ